jgi:short-subunit dehydrogenase
MQETPIPKTTRTALVTGASSGIGEAAARALAREGYALALIARRKDRLDLLVKEIEEQGGRALAIAADLADDEATQRAALEAIAWLGHVDLLVNNAGYSPGAAIEQVSRQDLRHIFDVNLLSALQLIGAVTPQMRAQGGGRIVNVGSVAALVPAPLAIPYAATKIGMHAATDASSIRRSSTTRATRARRCAKTRTIPTARRCSISTSSPSRTSSIRSRRTTSRR